MMNFLDILQYSSNLFLIVLSIFNVDYPKLETRCVLSALIVMIMWMKMLDLLRLFDRTAFFIKLILRTMVDVMPFFVIFFIFIFMFGSSLYILSMHRQSGQEIIDDIFDRWLINTFINQYLLTLGFYDMENFVGDQQLFIYILFILATFLTQVTVLNMLIAILGNTFDMVKES